MYVCVYISLSLSIYIYIYMCAFGRPGSLQHMTTIIITTMISSMVQLFYAIIRRCYHHCDYMS